jgi:hypothetical protein
MFLGADNYLHPRAIELIGKMLSKNPQADIAYFDMMIIGPLGAELASKVNAKKVGHSIRDNLDIFYWEFPDFTAESAKELKSNNFINGSAVFRTETFKRVGGYKKSYPEDHNLWVRMIESGSNAVRVPNPLLYYRQHSVSQANTMLNAQLELKHLRKLNANLMQEVSILKTKQSSKEMTKLLISIKDWTIRQLKKPIRILFHLVKKWLKH